MSVPKNTKVFHHNRQAKTKCVLLVSMNKANVVFVAVEGPDLSQSHTGRNSLEQRTHGARRSASRIWSGAAPGRERFSREIEGAVDLGWDQGGSPLPPPRSLDPSVVRRKPRSPSTSSARCCRVPRGRLRVAARSHTCSYICIRFSFADLPRAVCL